LESAANYLQITAKKARVTWISVEQHLWNMAALKDFDICEVIHTNLNVVCGILKYCTRSHQHLSSHDE
jgi:hypothetical protein